MRIELLDESIRIRRYRAADAAPLFEAARESAGESFTRWMPWCHAHYTREESVAFASSREEAWHRGEAYDFAILDQASGDFLGGVGLNQINREHVYANLGYWVRSSKMGRGVAVAATLLAARFGLEDLGLSRIEIVVAVDNKRSRRVAEKAGAHREGLLRRRLLIGDQLHDAIMYSLIKDD